MENLNKQIKERLETTKKIVIECNPWSQYETRVIYIPIERSFLNKLIKEELICHFSYNEIEHVLIVHIGG